MRNMLYDLGERCGVVCGQIRKYFPVELHVGVSEASDQLRVGSPVQSCACVDACNPQPPELALALSAISIGKQQRAVDGVFRDGVDLASATPVALGHGEDPLATSA
jgi:hypothetical protein